ncbi:MAG: Mov34/MPN/PAD-1 family protein [Anaerolineaceae bacterium]|nr:Mov34/MPN/PAD-1 family protein [Anaerolineaceae bacterium]MDD4042441.1 Mov34/MPN/PAD-1 family protein [Anaerolineaceae bacterium]MDD4577148.1 Mov34/MPN/PAD-1 family protein [Anaerolineaceae bacterium]
MEKNSKEAAVIFSEKAYLGIVAETYERVSTETGGIFLGKYHEGTWYVLETIDPGPKSIFTPTYFEYDTPYVNHLANKINRFYKESLEVLGLWHRHPGNFRTFSLTDDGTNIKFARKSENGAISALVNLDPGFTLTIYKVNSPLQYSRVDYLVDDSLIPADFKESKAMTDFLPTQSMTVIPAALPTSDPTLPIRKPRLIKGMDRMFSRVLHSLFRKKQATERTETAVSDTLTPVLPGKDPGVAPLLDMVNNELDFLESQIDYAYSLKVQDSELLVSMNYVRKMEYYPQKLEFAFGLSEAGGYALIEDKKLIYTPNFIMEQIHTAVNNYYVKK